LNLNRQGRQERQAKSFQEFLIDVSHDRIIRNPGIIMMSLIAHARGFNDSYRVFCKEILGALGVLGGKNGVLDLWHWLSFFQDKVRSPSAC
jgi:hypothetical protein